MRKASNIQWKQLPGWVRISAYMLGLVLLLAIAGNIYIKHLISNQLKQQVSSATRGFYKLDYQDVKVNLLMRKISLKNARLTVDSSQFSESPIPTERATIVFEGNFPAIDINGIHLVQMIFNRKVVCDQLRIESPHLTISQFHNSKSDSAAENNVLQHMFNGNKQGIEINNVKISNAQLRYRYFDETRAGPTFYDFKNLDLEVEGIKLNKGQDDSTNRVFPNNVSLRFSDYEYHTGDSMYVMTVHRFAYSLSKKSASIDKITIRPRLSEKDYSLKLPRQKARNDITLQNIRLNGVELWPLISKGEMYVDEGEIGSGYWKIFLSRIPPLPLAQQHVVPTQRLLNISEVAYLRKLHINNFQIEYREYNTITQKIGQVKFNNINGIATNITNDSSSLKKNPHLALDLNARLMGTGDFKARFDFLLTDPTGAFTVDAHLGKMDATQLNIAFIPLNKLEIKKGIIDEIRCNGKGNESGVTGKVNFLYHDLHIAVMERDAEADTLKRKTFTSMVANILVKNDNPKEDEAVRVADKIVLKRDPHRSFFNMLWMSLFTGIVKIVSGK